MCMCSYLHAADIKAAASEVGCKQKVSLAVAEVIKRLQPLHLCQVAVQLGGDKALSK